MIRKLCEAHHLPCEGELKAFVGEDAAGQIALCVGVIDGIAYAVDNACPHARAALAGGHLSGTNVVCPLHGWQWNIVSGKPVHEGDPTVAPMKYASMDLKSSSGYHARISLPKLMKINLKQVLQVAYRSCYVSGNVKPAKSGQGD